MTERRSELRPESSDRRQFPRPPLWLNILLLVLAVAVFGWARYHRNAVQEKSAVLFAPSENSPAELNRLRAELADMDLSREQLARELDSRTKYLNEIEGEQFYIAVDTTKQRLYFRLGDEVVREADLKVGPPATVKSASGKQWTFVPLRGAVNVRSKEQDHAWHVPEWLYAMQQQAVPAERPVIAGGLGKYVIFLPNGYLIHSPPPAESPLRGPKPGSFMVPEQDLAAIWPRISERTRVYVF